MSENENLVTTKMQQADETNSRYVLELERNVLLDQQAEFDRKYGTFSFAFLTSIESLAVLAYLAITLILLLKRVNRTKTNFVIAIWSLLNVIVLLAKISRQVNAVAELIYYPKHFSVLEEMLGALSRTYGTCLFVVWFFNRYCRRINPKFNWFLYFIMFIPALVFISFTYIYFVVDPLVYEAFTPGSDIINLAIYFAVTILFIFCQTVNEECYSHSHYVLLISIVNLVSNFPVCLTAVYIRFVLDVSWVYRFHIYFVDFILDIIVSSNAFIALLIIFLCKNKMSNKDNSYYF